MGYGTTGIAGRAPFWLPGSPTRAFSGVRGFCECAHNIYYVKLWLSVPEALWVQNRSSLFPRALRILALASRCYSVVKHLAFHPSRLAVLLTWSLPVYRRCLETGFPLCHLDPLLQ